MNTQNQNSKNGWNDSFQDPGHQPAKEEPWEMGNQPGGPCHCPSAALLVFRPEHTQGPTWVGSGRWLERQSWESKETEAAGSQRWSRQESAALQKGRFGWHTHVSEGATWAQGKNCTHLLLLGNKSPQRQWLNSPPLISRSVCGSGAQVQRGLTLCPLPQAVLKGLTWVQHHLDKHLFLTWTDGGQDPSPMAACSLGSRGDLAPGSSGIASSFSRPLGGLPAPSG